MPHPRHRYLDTPLKSALSHSPIAGIVGQRQVGKTTLASGLSESYATFDRADDLDSALAEPGRFLARRKHPFVIDECQLCPALFPALKERVRTHPAKGQFILTGSVRFTSRRAIRESLTGRIVTFDLLPFSPAESHGEPLPSFLVRFQESPLDATAIHRPPSTWLTRCTKRFEEFLATGGLPGICFFRASGVRATRFEAQIETALERDLRLILNTPVPFRKLRALLAAIASSQGEPVNASALGRRLGLSPPTVMKLVSAFEATFLVRTIATERQVRPVVFLEDQGMATHLAAEASSPETDLRRGLFSTVLPQFLYRPDLVPVFYQYRTRSGARVDFAIQTRLGRIGVIPVADDVPTPSSLASARSFVSSADRAKIVIAHLGTEVRQVSENIVSVPYPYLVSDGWR